ncbi:hypothetical protein COO60DRAFT_1634073 [Scenedesmus sp. NREL 46B-D3]|nr:hypothetical protein COO60DRAFT_1634073 [Scenedesmus sp. NREL 46B-D3]
MASSRVALAVLCVALVATCLAGAEARIAFPGRSLQQFTCSAAQALKGQCDALCKCVADDPAYKNSGRQASECTGPCQSCVGATSSCPPDDALPEACKAYSNDPAVKKCIGSRRLA